MYHVVGKLFSSFAREGYNGGTAATTQEDGSPAQALTDAAEVRVACVSLADASQKTGGWWRMSSGQWPQHEAHAQTCKLGARMEAGGWR